MLLVKDILNRSAALLNDTALTTFTYAFQLPHFRVAYDEIKELLQANNVPATNQEAEGIVINVGVNNIGGPGGPALPPDLVEIQGLWEKTNGTSESYMEMTRTEFLPPIVVPTQSLMMFSFNNQYVQFPTPGATSVRAIKIQYVANSLPDITDENSFVTLINANTFLAFRTAALCANYIGENETRATYLNGEAQLAIDRFLNTNTKSRQGIFTRRRPFRAGWKSINNWW